MRARGRHAAGIQLAWVALVVILVMTTWFSMTAVVPTLRSEWGLGRTAAAWLTMSVQLGFVVGSLGSAVLNLADRVPSRALISLAALACAVLTAAVTMTDGVLTAVILRFLTGMALACVYPPALFVVVGWFSTGRGLAVGIMIGALTLGSALPHLMVGAALPWREVLLLASGCALLGAVLAALLVRDRPGHAVRPRFRPGYAASLLRPGLPRLAILGYVGHMWELYAMWTWLPSYVLASNLASDGHGAPVALTTFAAIGLAGLAGCLIAGRLGDTWGRERLAAAAMLVSGISCLLAAGVFGLHPVLVVPVLLVWGMSVIADSGLFSASLSEVVDVAYTGTALTLQTSAGYLVTTLSIQLTGLLSDHAGWRVAVAILAIGPFLGLIAMLRLSALRHGRALEPPPATGWPGRAARRTV